MADSIEMLVTKNIVTTLQGLTIANGYQVELKQVSRPNQKGVDLGVVPNAVVTNAGVRSPDQDPNHVQEFTKSYDIEVTRTDAAETTRTSDEVDELWFAEMTKCLLVDHRRGGYAQDTKVPGYVPFAIADGNPEAGIVVDVQVRFQHGYGNPYVSAPL